MLPSSPFHSFYQLQIWPLLFWPLHSFCVSCLLHLQPEGTLPAKQKTGPKIIKKKN